MQSQGPLCIEAIDVAGLANPFGIDLVLQLRERAFFEFAVFVSFIQVAAGSDDPVPLAKIAIGDQLASGLLITQDGIAPGVHGVKHLSRCGSDRRPADIANKIAAVLILLVVDILPFASDMCQKLALAVHGIDIARFTDIYFF